MRCRCEFSWGLRSRNVESNVDIYNFFKRDKLRANQHETIKAQCCTTYLAVFSLVKSSLPSSITECMLTSDGPASGCRSPVDYLNTLLQFSANYCKIDSYPWEAPVKRKRNALFFLCLGSSSSVGCCFVRWATSVSQTLTPASLTIWACRGDHWSSSSATFCSLLDYVTLNLVNTENATVQTLSNVFGTLNSQKTEMFLGENRFKSCH